MAVNDISGVRIVGRYQGQNIVHIMHYKHTAQTVNEQQTLQLLCDAWDNAFTAMWKARHIDTYQLVGVKAFVQDGAAKTPGFTDIGENGTVVGEEVPAAVCRTITLYTSSAKFRRRGRVQLSGCDTTMFNSTDGAVTDAEITALGTLADELIDPLVTDEESWTPVLPANDVDPVVPIIDSKVQRTPSLIRSRRVRNFLIG